VFQRSVSPEALIGLEHFSHVWVVFVFHMNTNGKNSRAHRGLRADSHRFTFPAKIAPPMLKERVGVFSTRSPHRPNPVGITLATVVSIDQRARTVFLSGIDLVDGTPVLDIKPYVPGKFGNRDDRLHLAWLALDAICSWSRSVR
jgi:tRNA-Thr(GGU) m(6)t(6)A37 methyltransferase TsaA